MIVTFKVNNKQEIELVNKKLDYIDKQIRLGKRKTLTPKEALGDYAKHITNSNKIKK